MDNEKLLTILNDIKTKLAIIEQKVDNTPTKLECQNKHSKQTVFNVVISILIAVYLFNVKISHLLKVIGL